MRRRIRAQIPHPSTRVDAVPGVVAEVVPIATAARLVTLEDPTAPPTLAEDAFARIRPPEGTTPSAVASWRESVARVARAVRVVATPRAADVPLASTRVDAAASVGSIREEAEALAAETNDDEVVALVKRLLDEVGA